jgi:phosphonate transport system substrate-binding protein
MRPGPHAGLRLGLPPSLGQQSAGERANRLSVFLTRGLGQPWQVSIADSYDGLAKDVLSGRLDAAWAPPFVCARLEAMGVRVLVRGVRRGASTYRAALVGRQDARITLERLQGLTALWVDRDSVGGYLLAMAYLKGRGFEPSKVFFAQQFAGSYKAALEGVAGGRAEVTSVFAPPAHASTDGLAGVDDVAPALRKQLAVIALTDESPNDGIAVAMSVQPALAGTLEKVLLGMHGTPEGASLAKDLFNAERFEAAPKMGYRALYRVALATV